MPTHRHWSVPEPKESIAMDLFTIIPVFIGVIFVLVIVSIILRAGKGIAEWAENNSKPVLSEQARIVAKCSETRGQVGSNTAGSVSTWYYATFELPSGDRQEFSIGGREYGMLSDSDEGTLTYQGTRYRGFQRGRG
jgi:hypothetical protein